MNISTDFLRTGGLTGSQQSSGVGGATEAPASPETSASGQAADTASLSTAGSAASAASSIGAEVRGEKVSSVQLALADGSYNVPSYEVAGKVIEHMLVNG